MRKGLALVVMLLVALWIALPVSAAETGERNLLFTVTVIDTPQMGEATQRATEILALSGTRADLITGWRVPIPTRSTEVEGVAGSVTSFSYQDVGFLAWIDGRITGEGGVHANGRIEVSAVEPSEAMAPTIANFTQKFDVVLADGVEVTLAEAPRPDGGSVRLRISAEIQP